MTEPTSATTVGLTATGVGLATLLPGIDPDALVGAFAGGTLFVVSAPGMPIWQRLIYLAISIAGGYHAAQEVLRWLPIESAGLAAFGASALVITITLAAIEHCKKFDFSRLFRRGGPPNG